MLKKSICLLVILFNFTLLAQAQHNPYNDVQHKTSLIIKMLGYRRPPLALMGNIFLNTYGEELTTLKENLDRQNNRYDMEYIVFKLFKRNTYYKAKLLFHFQKEGKKVPRKNHVFSDIDDTLYSSYKDRRYPKNTTYPGIRAFHREIGGLTFVTARPRMFGALERKTHRMLNNRNIQKRSILMGSLGHLFTYEGMAAKKMENMDHYISIFPEYNYIWVGDNGQGDVKAGRRLLRKYPQRVKTVLIHNVTGASEYRKEELMREGIYLFETYAQAAKFVHEKGLIDRQAYLRVVQAYQEDLNEIWASKNKKARPRHIHTVER